MPSQRPSCASQSAGGNQRQDRMVVAGAEDLDGPAVLQVPQQIAAFDDAVHPFLEIRPRQRLQQRSGKGKVHAPDILVRPERPRDAVHGQEGFPWPPTP